MMDYLVVVERTGRNYSAYLPDVPGCIAAGRSQAECLSRIRTALAMHVAGLKTDGQKPPKPRSVALRVAV